jgi:hypothetical protein
MGGRRSVRCSRPGVFAVIVLVAASVGGPRAVGESLPGIPPGVVVSEDPVDWTPHVLDGRVYALARVGNRMVVGGSFSKVRQAESGEILTRRNLFAFDVSSGAVATDFVPDPDGSVGALAPAPDGSSVFVGGHFRQVGGSPAKSLAKLDTLTGGLSPDFRVAVAGKVEDIAVHDSRLFVAGSLSSVNGTTRSGLAAVDTVTGALDPNLDIPFSEPRDGTLAVTRIDVTPDGSRLVALGGFGRAAGQERHQIAVLDVGATPARLADWHTDRYQVKCSDAFPNTYMRDVDISPDGSFFVVVTTGARAKPTLCDTAARWEIDSAGSDLEPTWVAYTGGDTLTGVGVTEAAVYVGGHPRWMNNYYNNGTGKDATPGPGAVPRSGIAALDPANGLPLSWNPGRIPRGLGVFAFLPTPEGLWVGSDTDRIGGELRPRLAMLPVVGGKTIPQAVPGGLPGDLYLLAPGKSPDLVGQSFDGTTASLPSVVGGGIDWSRARGAFMLSGHLYTGWDDGRLEVRSFDGTTLGAPTAVDLRGLTKSHFPVAKLTGMFFDGGRLYYTVSGERKLFYRYFTAESGVVGTQTFVASGKGDGVDWRAVRGLTMASAQMYYALGDGSLHRIDFREGRPVAATHVLVSEPPASPDGRSWRSRGMFVLSR